MRNAGNNSMQWVWLGLAGLVVVFGVVFSMRKQASEVAASETGETRPVLVELFTSEGCSSCPPADAFLAKLDAEQPVAGARVIVLSEHVTYWDRLGWRDPYSLDAITRRQEEYGSRFGLDSVYTPQLVVDGAAEMVGSDQRKITDAVARAAAAPKAELSIANAQLSGGALHFSVRGGSSGSGTKLMGALAEDAVQSSVLRGENSGRTLKHVAVVRSLQELGSGAADGREQTLKLPASRENGAVRLVVFAVEKRSGHVVALAEQTVRPS